MTREPAPEAVVELADARAAARRARDWTTADRLKAEIEAAGWKVLDAATLYTLERAVPPDVVDGDRILHGSSRSVPSRLEDLPIGIATVVIVASGEPADTARAVRVLADHAPDGTQLVVVANDPSPGEARVLRDLDAADPGAPGVTTEVVWTAVRLEPAAALNAGIRRAAAPVVIVLDPAAVISGDVVSALVAALDDPGVAVAGPFGLVSDEPGRFGDAPSDAIEVAAVRGTLLAFRRADYAARGPLDEGFTGVAWLDAWWSLALRDVPDDAADDAAPRRAVQVAGLPVERPVPSPGAEAAESRAARRNRYRLLKRFATRRDLLVDG